MPEREVGRVETFANEEEEGLSSRLKWRDPPTKSMPCLRRKAIVIHRESAEIVGDAQMRRLWLQLVNQHSPT